MYEDGLGGLEQDEAEAVKWYRRAAEQGNADAQMRLGVMYGDGRGGLAEDYAEAVKWYRRLSLAAAKGYDCADKCDNLASKMTPAQIAEAQRLAREWKPTK
jgi:TPR repeat protein